MQVNQNGSSFEFVLEGAIGETCPLFEYELKDVARIVLNMEKVTYINSIGVKTWIQWVGRVPMKIELVLKRVPLVIVNQASTVAGFLPMRAMVESFYAPFICPECDTDTTVILSEGKEYCRENKGQPAVVNLPSVPCPKCQATTEPDFSPAKTFVFLSDRPEV